MFDTTNAACVGEPIDTFFHEGNLVENNSLEKKAKSLCNSCPVVEQCLTYAVLNKEEFGIWGGKTPHERRILRDRMRRGRNDRSMVIKLALQPKKKK